jgi:hypothetical protein
MSGTGKEKIYGIIAVKPDCQHRAIQLCKVQDEPFLSYVCGRCSAKFKVERVVDAPPSHKEPMFPKNPVPWGLRSRQA